VLKGDTTVELEQRVKTLEYEFKILKNEIQRMLLDIEEQVLVHYYPTLRAGDSVAPEGIAQAVEAIRAKQGSASASASAPAMPAAKKISLDEVRAASAPVPPSAAAAPSTGKGMDQATMVKLSEWVSSSALKIGGERTGKLIEMSAGSGIVPPQFKDVLKRLASLNKGAAPEKVAVNEVLGALLKLYELMGRAANVEEALALIEEAKLG
jgi:hypothetical protein